MKIICRGSDRWRQIDCYGCISTLEIEDEDVKLSKTRGSDEYLGSVACPVCGMVTRGLLIPTPAVKKLLRLKGKHAARQ